MATLPEGLYDFRCNYNNAYHKDAAGNDYFGYAARTSLEDADATAAPIWQIVKLEYTGDNWIMKWADGDDLPDNIWDNVEAITYTLLRKR
jgi:hypothetical protein